MIRGGGGGGGMGGRGSGRRGAPNRKETEHRSAAERRPVLRRTQDPRLHRVEAKIDRPALEAFPQPLVKFIEKIPAANPGRRRAPPPGRGQDRPPRRGPGPPRPPGASAWRACPLCVHFLPFPCVSFITQELARPAPGARVPSCVMKDTELEKL